MTISPLKLLALYCLALPVLAEPPATDAGNVAGAIAAPVDANAAPTRTADSAPTPQDEPVTASAETSAPLVARQTQTEGAVAGSADTVELGTTAIKGSQELPRVLYIVPWKKALPGELAGRPANSLLDEALAPVDREVFVRQLNFYDQIQSANTEAGDAD